MKNLLKKLGFLREPMEQLREEGKRVEEDYRQSVQYVIRREGLIWRIRNAIRDRSRQEGGRDDDEG